MTSKHTGEGLLAEGIVGGRIGRYRLIGLLATGGMAQVYLALSGELSGFRTLVVVKRILPHLASDSHFIRMFFDEARIVARLDHPNIVRITEIGHDNDQYFLAMEVVQGRPLAAVLRRGVKQRAPLTHAQSAFIVAQAADGLGYAHNLCDANGRPLNIVHRDVSPQNILVSFEGAVKVIDFGVARAIDRVSETRPGGLKGKIHYMAPEQVATGHVDRRSDVFALGVVLWEALCGRRLFRRDSELETMRAIVREPILPPSKLMAISPHLERIVMRALEKEPMNRFQDAEEMALALERFAFATAGFSPLQVATTMKTLFASDYARWKRTVAAAMDQEGSPEGWANIRGTILRPRGPADSTRRSTVALPGGSDQSGALSGPTDQLRSDSRSSDSREFTLPDPPGGLRRHVVVAGALVLGLGLAMGLFALSRPRATINVIRPAGTEISTMRIVPLPREPQVPQGPPEDQIAAATTETGLVAAGPVIQPDPSSMVPTAMVPTAMVPTAVVPTAMAATATGTAATSPPEPSPTGITPKIAGEPAPSAPSRIATGSAVESSARKLHPTGRGHPRRASNGRKASRAGIETGDVSRAPAAAAPCRMTVGTRPWSEVWIDGKNTRAHTPYSAAIDCGEHKLAFKRADLGFVKTMTVAVRSGEPFKLSFALDED
jgi:serine/threonine protein kinase